MLQSYQGIYDHGRLIWLSDKPSIEEAHVIVTLLPAEKDAAKKTKCQPSSLIAGRGKILGDIIAPAAPIEDWNRLA
ncbi:MAG: hypothetical protein WC856_20035 [Methylococcaceae bacterium]|jgi:hypothetical protein